MKTSIFQTVLIAVFGALAVGGVLVFALFVSSNNNNAIGPVVIWGTFDADAMTTVIRAAAENDPRFAQVSYVQKDPLTYEQSLTDALAQGTGPDLFLISQDYAVRDAGKTYEIPYQTLSANQFQTTFVQAGNPYLDTNGIVALPLVADPMLMYWNRDLLSAAGFTQPPAYWDELSNFAQRVVQRDNSGGITRAAVAFGEYANVDNAKDILALLIMQAGGSITTRDNLGHLVPVLSAYSAGASTGGQAAQSALLFYTEFADPSQKNEYSWNRGQKDAQTAFAAGDLALYFGYASEAGQIARTNPNLNVGVAPVPQVRGGKTLSVARVYGLAAARTSKNLQGAVTIATVLAGHDMSNSFAQALGISSARRDVVQAASTQPQAITQLVNQGLCAGTDILSCSTALAQSWTDPDPAKTNDLFRTMIESITSGSARIQDALTRADQTMAAILGQ